MVEKGSNVGFQIGSDVFTIADFRAFIQSHVVGAVLSAMRGLPPVTASLALVASCLQPDRLPAHLLNLGAIVLQRLQLPTCPRGESGSLHPAIGRTGNRSMRYASGHQLVGLLPFASSTAMAIRQADADAPMKHDLCGCLRITRNYLVFRSNTGVPPR